LDQIHYSLFHYLIYNNVNKQTGEGRGRRGGRVGGEGERGRGRGDERERGEGGKWKI
jgi:hypothetical protein